MANDMDGIMASTFGALKCLRELGEALGSLDDTLRTQIGEIERGLGEIRLGVEISITISDPADDNEALSYMKGYSGWGLYVVTAGANTKRLTECSRAQRAQAVWVHIEMLLEAGIEQVQEKVRERHKSISSGRVLIKAIEESNAARNNDTGAR